MAFVWAGIIQDNKNLVLSFEYGKQPFEIVNKSIRIKTVKGS